VAVLSPPGTAVPTRPAVGLQRAAPQATSHAARLLRVGEHVAVAAALVWTLGPLAHGVGGRDHHVLSIGLVLAALSAVAVAPRRLPLGVLAAALAPGLAAGAVCLLTPTHTFGLAWAGGYLLAGLLAVTVGAYTLGRPAGSRRPWLVAGLVALAGLDQFGHAFEPWWGGGGNSNHPMIGTFYWHDPFAAFLLAPALIGLGFVLDGHRGLRVLGVAAAAVSSAGIVLSTSRAALACLAAGWIVVAVIGARARGLRRAAIGTLITAATTYLLLLVLTGPPLFDDRASILGATASRTSGQSLSRNGGFRVEFWHEAWHGFTQHIWAGGGFGSLASSAASWVPKDWAISPLAHNGYLQALNDGGLLLGVPVIAITVWVVLATRRPLGRAVVRRDERSLLPAVVGVALLGLLAHSAIDFDWSYPALLAVVGVLVGLLIGDAQGLGAHREVRSSRPSRVGGVALVLASAVVLVATVSGSFAHGLRLNANLTPTAPVGVPQGGAAP
jgi:O-antigen ligase/polysaccharide polymerase Wzy-like membrane protein